MINRILSISYLAFMGISSVVLFVIAVAIWLLTVLFDKRLYILHFFTSAWASLYIWIMPAWSISIQGKENIRKKTYIVVSNHQSLLDILVAFRIFFHFKWVSKSEIFNIPFIGWNMRLNRYIRLVRGDKSSSRLMFDACNKEIARGSSIYLFPEGSRSDTGRLKPFKPGAFLLAKENMLPILPIVITGTKNILPKYKLVFQGIHKIKVKILNEISYDTFKDLTAEKTGEMVRENILKNIG
ncbi:lysophospholipid acyltransferase family protein [Desulfobacterales bacterium HSG16]|nr:lysophospholipid acyltransferase family protein [Desulfobacterales bacterium HSG16]